ncbi:potassium transporter TrkG [Nonomuraea sp. H19]|uniref:potassium transporter TrkG n=1 Tax=Nonomuraea sp. H19 TaxID=3452206 RepID=UPI003F89EAD7
MVGTLVILATEWRNPATSGRLDDPGKLLAAFFAGVMPRTAGFNSLDIAQLYPTRLLATDVLMFIGGGSAGTAGGIKVTTFGLPAFMIWAEMRGEPRVNVGHRRLAESAQRQVISITAIRVGLVGVATYILLALTPHSLDQVLFEVVSAFGTVGLSTGITADAAARRAPAVGAAHVRRPDRAADAGLGARAEGARSSLRTTRGACHRWLTRRATRSW